MRLPLAVLLASIQLASGVEVSGPIVDSANNHVANARVTLFTSDLSVFQEARSSSSGEFKFPMVANGSYWLGVAARNCQYAESALDVPARMGPCESH